MIGSQSFGEPMPMDCEFHQCFSVYPHILGGTGWPEGAIFVYIRLGSDNPSRIGSGKIVSPEDSLIKNRKFWYVSKCFLFFFS